MPGSSRQLHGNGQKLSPLGAVAQIIADEY